LCDRALPDGPRVKTLAIFAGCITQKIERKHLTLRTRIKRLARRTIGFSKAVLMHDTVIGLFINRYEFGRAI